MAPIYPVPAPPLSTPPSHTTITLQALDTTSKLYVKSANFLSPTIPGHEIYNCPTMAFLLTHTSSKRKILFDAGVRKDYWNYSPLITSRFASSVNVHGLRVDQGVDEILTSAGIKLEEIEAVIWSHWHFDHVGNLSLFPSSTRIIVGPSFKSNLLPGYPAKPGSPLLESDYAEKIIDEVSFDEGVKIGKFRAHDFFSDGSFYLLDVPGHAVGHMCGLARTTTNPESFVLLGADTCHFAGALRPSVYVPLPEELDGRWGLDTRFANPCPWEVFGSCHPKESEVEKRTVPYYTASKVPGSAYVDPDRANESIQGLKEFDASDDVLICLAHDPALFEILPLLNQDPRNDINDWKEKGYKEKLRWRFLNELPRDGKPGREPIVLGFWRDGKEVSAEEALAK